jgi:hypothetical protein
LERKWKGGVVAFLRYPSNIFLERLRETTTKTQDRELKWEPPEYKAGVVLPTRYLWEEVSEEDTEMEVNSKNLLPDNFHLYSFHGATAA